METNRPQNRRRRSTSACQTAADGGLLAGSDGGHGTLHGQCWSSVHLESNPPPSFILAHPIKSTLKGGKLAWGSAKHQAKYIQNCSRSVGALLHLAIQRLEVDIVGN